MTDPLVKEVRRMGGVRVVAVRLPHNPPAYRVEIDGILCRVFGDEQTAASCAREAKAATSR